MLWFKKKNKQPKKVFSIAFCDKADLSTQYYSYRTFDTKEECIAYIKLWWRYSIEKKIENDTINAYKISGGGDWLVVKETTEEEVESINSGIKLLTMEELYRGMR